MLTNCWIKNRILESISVKFGLINNQEIIDQIKNVADIVIQVFRNNNKIILFGNGGSAADAQHIAAEFVGKFYFERKSLPAIALTTNTSCLTALANDYDFSEVFARQLQGLGQKKDVAIGISTSGNSENVIQALRIAKDIGLATVGLTGKDGGKLGDVVDHCICVPSEDTPRIQEGHILIGHIICEIVEGMIVVGMAKRRIIGNK